MLPAGQRLGAGEFLDGLSRGFVIALRSMPPVGTPATPIASDGESASTIFAAVSSIARSLPERIESRSIANITRRPGCTSTLRVKRGTGAASALTMWPASVPKRCAISTWRAAPSILTTKSAACRSMIGRPLGSSTDASIVRTSRAERNGSAGRC
jgi:hypothetical protein